MKLNLILTALILTAAASAQPQTPTPPPAPDKQEQAAPATPAQPAQEATPAPAPRVRTRTRIVTPKAAAPAMAMAWAGEGGSYLGVDIDEVTSDRVKALKLKEERGVEITMVDQDAPAAKAGLKEHDVVTEFNGQRVEGGEQFKRFIRETPAGRIVTLGIVRDGQPMQIKATLGDRKEAWARETRKFRMVNPKVPQIVVPDIDVDIPAIEMDMGNMQIMSPAVSTGIVVDNLTPQLAQFFGVKAGQGILVKSVERGSAAEKGGMRAGDVIIKVGDETIESRSDYRQAIRHRDNANVKVVVIRDKKEQTLTLTLPPPRKESGRVFEFDNDSDNDFDFDFDFDTTAMNHMVKAFSMKAPRIKVDARGIVDSVNSSMRDAVRRIAIDAPVAVREVY
jgi:membrane-associated protease RseP (regulator of RpoE activity)